MKKIKIIFPIIIGLIITSIIIYFCLFNSKSNLNKNANINDIKQNDNINIYMFWGDGCPHCAKEYEFFESIKKDYNFNLYGFEIWFNSENKELMKKYNEAFNEEVNSVPYLIIGKKTFSGFNEEIKKEIIEELNKNDNYDVYFDKIKDM